MSNWKVRRIGIVVYLDRTLRESLLIVSKDTKEKQLDEISSSCLN